LTLEHNATSSLETSGSEYLLTKRHMLEVLTTQVDLHPRKDLKTLPLCWSHYFYFPLYLSLNTRNCVSIPACQHREKIGTGNLGFQLLLHRFVQKLVSVSTDLPEH